MIFTKTITTPANTLELEALESILEITKALIYQVEIYFPPGSSGLLNCYINYSNHRLYPNEESETFFGDNITISFKDLFEIKSAPKYFNIFTWNEDDTYPHTIQIRIGAVSLEEYIEHYLPARATNAMLEYMKTQDEQAGLTDMEKKERLIEYFTGKNIESI